MAIITVTRAATPDEISAEMDRRGAVIERLETAVRHWREECGKLHAQQNSLKTAAVTLRAFAGGDAVVPDNLRRVSYSAMEAIANWLWPLEDPEDSEDEEPESLWECKP